MVERRPYKADVVGSIPAPPTIYMPAIPFRFRKSKTPPERNGQAKNVSLRKIMPKCLLCLFPAGKIRFHALAQYEYLLLYKALPRLY